MSDFLTSLAAVTLGLVPTIKPDYTVQINAPDSDENRAEQEIEFSNAEMNHTIISANENSAISNETLSDQAKTSTDTIESDVPPGEAIVSISKEQSTVRSTQDSFVEQSDLSDSEIYKKNSDQTKQLINESNSLMEQKKIFDKAEKNILNKPLLVESNDKELALQPRNVPPADLQSHISTDSKVPQPTIKLENDDADELMDSTSAMSQKTFLHEKSEARQGDPVRKEKSILNTKHYSKVDFLISKKLKTNTLSESQKVSGQSIPPTSLERKANTKQEKFLQESQREESEQDRLVEESLNKPFASSPDTSKAHLLGLSQIKSSSPIVKSSQSQLRQTNKHNQQKTSQLPQKTTSVNVHINIGRIELKPDSAKAPIEANPNHIPAKPSSSAISLDDYLTKRNEGLL